MDEDLIVVDDDVSPPIPATNGQTSPEPVAPQIVPQTSKRPSRLRKETEHAASGSTDRTTRSSHLRPKTQPKLKLKLSEKAAALASGTSFLGSYDRELDSDDEDLAFEEQFILRAPPGEDCERLRKMAQAREVSNDVWFKFKDSRRAVFHIGSSLYSAKLVDLPCIIESQKTLDNKQMFKVADIGQMLVLENRINAEDEMSNQKGFNIDEFIWPHGITPPLHHVRKRRFRKRVNRRTIETVEQEVERLLESDALATQVTYDILENVNPDLSDSEFIEREEADAPTPGPGSDAGDAPTPGAGGGGDDDDDEEGEGDIDEELAAELEFALGDEDGDEEDGDDEEQSEDEEDEDDEDDEDVQAKRLLNEEIRDLEAAVTKKGTEIASSSNPLIKRRFEDALKKLQADLEMKLAQREELKEQQQMRKAGISSQREDSEPNDDLEESGGVDMEGDIFGDDDPDDVGMDIG
ncbi:hypothetical protein BD410DRAFT_724172 [Rickenella mellea]|uniref:TAFII55 protein conserved region domain-containing protein n=1 Tax=Rickenella mellea TaxID=50990 RepID=A0A4Y7Q2Q3_9AGAM|nr:hypothetical protein BD410DRAFT_724172 [Rickenella mellea]